jgi:hypothetical protein
MPWSFAAAKGKEKAPVKARILPLFALALVLAGCA